MNVKSKHVLPIFYSDRMHACHVRTTEKQRRARRHIDLVQTRYAYLHLNVGNDEDFGVIGLFSMGFHT